MAAGRSSRNSKPLWDLGRIDVHHVFTEGLIKPIVDSVFKADDVAEAYAKLESGEQYGKVVVDWR